MKAVSREQVTLARPCSETNSPGHEAFAMDERSESLAKNEAIFRAGNDSIDHAAGGRVGNVPYLCECGEKTCLATVELSPAEYEAVRSHPARFFVVPGPPAPTSAATMAQA